MPLMPNANPSAFFIATRFGTSSPKTRLKYANISVIRKTENDFKMRSGASIPAFCITCTSVPAKFSAANAEPSSPANVIATCIVDKNFVGCAVSAAKRFARTSPSLAIRSNLVSFIEITAISALAKTAFKPIRITCSKIASIIFHSPLLLSVYVRKNQKRHTLPPKKQSTPFLYFSTTYSVAAKQVRSSSASMPILTLLK